MVLKAPLKNIDELTIDGELYATGINSNIFRNRAGSQYMLVHDTGSIYSTNIKGNLIFPINAPTASAPTAVESGLFYDTTKDSLCLSNATPAWKTLLTEEILWSANSTAISIGNASTEGGDIKIYRDTSNNLQFSLDADAASNGKAVDIYGGVVIQNYLTVGQTTLETSYTMYTDGTMACTGTFISGSNIFCGSAGKFKANTNNSNLSLDITINSPDAADHTVNLQIDANDIIVAKATGNGAGGVTNLKAIIYAPLFLDGTPQTLTGAGAVNITTSITHIVTTAADALTLADGSEGQIKIIIMKTDGGDGTLTPAHPAGFATITFDDVGDSATLIFTNSAWHWIGGTATLG